MKTALDVVVIIATFALLLHAIPRLTRKSQLLVIALTGVGALHVANVLYNLL